MNETMNETQVLDTEVLARFILASKMLRASDGTVRQDAFIPHPHMNLSVTRHIGLTEKEIWVLGHAVAAGRPATLYGRADVTAFTVRKHKLDIVPTATPRNHANIVGWPTDKPSQKILALEIAATAKFVPIPTANQSNSEN